MNLSPRAIEAAAEALSRTFCDHWFGPNGIATKHKMTRDFVNGSSEWKAEAQAAITAALAVDGLCLVEQRSESSTELKIGDRVRVSMRRRRLMYETEPFWRGQIIGETREGHAWIVRRDLYKTPAVYHKNFCSKELAAASTGDSPRQREG